jgi:APA family basic amino acid/polyamine antiporter
MTNIVVGSVVGADIYIASAITAGLLGSFSLVVWVAAGIFATIIALVFAYCSYYVPKEECEGMALSKKFCPECGCQENS